MISSYAYIIEVLLVLDQVRVSLASYHQASHLSLLLLVVR